MSGPYDDIINLPHHVSAKRPQMPNENRAAQFSPFAALTGYDAAIEETARLTDERIVLSEEEIAILSEKLRMVIDRLDERPQIAITYFQPDGTKDGGAYITASGAVKKIDNVESVVIFVSGDRIAIADIIAIELGAITG